MKNIKVGILPIACSRFKGMGKETPLLYEERIQVRLEEIEKEVSSFASVFCPGQIYVKEDIQKAMDMFYENKVDCVFAFFLSWSEDFAWIRFLRDMYPVPLFFAHITPGINYKNTEEEDPFIEYLSTGGLVGALEGSGSFKRFDRPMTYAMCGTLPEVVNKLKEFSQAASVRSDLRQAVFGLLNNYNEVMWSTYVDPFALFAKLGPELRFISVATLEDADKAVSEDRVDACIKKLTAQYESRNDVELDHFKASMRCSLAMEDIARREGIGMMVLNDVGAVLYERMGLRPGFYPTPENNGDVLVVPEGDIGVGLSVYILNKLTGDHVNIIEPAYIENDGSLMVVHAGPNDYTDKRGKTIIARDVRFARSKWKHAGAPFAWHVIHPGEKTVLHMSQKSDGSFKMVAFKSEALEHEHSLASYTHGRLVFPGKKTDEIMTALMQEGVTQHYAVAPGDVLPALRFLAGLLGVDYIEL